MSSCRHLVWTRPNTCPEMLSSFIDNSIKDMLLHFDSNVNQWLFDHNDIPWMCLVDKVWWNRVDFKWIITSVSHRAGEKNSRRSRYWQFRQPLEHAVSTSSLSIGQRAQSDSSTSSKVFLTRSYPCREASTSAETSTAGDLCRARWITTSHRSWMTTTCSSKSAYQQISTRVSWTSELLRWPTPPPCHGHQRRRHRVPRPLHRNLHHRFSKTWPCVPNLWNEKFQGHGLECIPFKAPADGGFYGIVQRHKRFCGSTSRLHRRRPSWAGSTQADYKVMWYAFK